MAYHQPYRFRLLRRLMLEIINNTWVRPCACGRCFTFQTKTINTISWSCDCKQNGTVATLGFYLRPCVGLRCPDLRLGRPCSHVFVPVGTRRITFVLRNESHRVATPDLAEAKQLCREEGSNPTSRVLLCFYKREIKDFHYKLPSLPCIESFLHSNKLMTDTLIL
jgi:hypothetical protein